jgi:hypothetical protein
MNDSPDLQTPWGQGTPPAAAEPSRYPERERKLREMVQVDQAASWTECVFWGARPKTKFDAKRPKDAPREQLTDYHGVPIWQVKVSVRHWKQYEDEDEMLLTVSVPSTISPNDQVSRGEFVEFGGLVFGVSNKRDGSGYATWYLADSVSSSAGVGSRSLKVAAEA